MNNDNKKGKKWNELKISTRIKIYFYSFFCLSRNLRKNSYLIIPWLKRISVYDDKGNEVIRFGNLKGIKTSYAPNGLPSSSYGFWREESSSSCKDK